jgi:hypothetical protein
MDFAGNRGEIRCGFHLRDKKLNQISTLGVTLAARFY